MHTRYTKLQLTNDYMLVVISKYCSYHKTICHNNSNKDVYSQKK